MARARLIKPGFYANEDLAECSDAARLLFPALWQLADREGRLEDKPKRIAAYAFAYEPRKQSRVDAYLGELADAGFISRYQGECERYILITHFLDHQNPHHREPPSHIPAPGQDGPSPRPALGQPQASPNLAPTLPQPSRVESESESVTESVTGLIGVGVGNGVGTAPSDALLRDRLIAELGISQQRAAREVLQHLSAGFDPTTIAEAITRTAAHAPRNPLGYLTRVLTEMRGA